MVKLAVVGIVNDNEKILVGKKRTYKDNDALGEKWHIPGGKVEQGENPDSAIMRELLEETGIKISITKVLDAKVVKKNEDLLVVIWYECKPMEKTKATANELSEIKWVAKSQVWTTLDKEAIEVFPSSVIDYFKESL